MNVLNKQFTNNSKSLTNNRRHDMPTAQPLNMSWPLTVNQF